MAAIRRAEATWSGDLQTGSGTVSAVTSGAFAELPVSWAARTEASDGRTSPEELVAAAHAACYSMALSNTLSEAGNPPERLHVVATVSLDPRQGGGVEVTRSALEVTGAVAGLDQAGFQEAAEKAEKGCPISNAIRGNVAVTVDATLKD